MTSIFFATLLLGSYGGVQVQRSADYQSQDQLLLLGSGTLISNEPLNFHLGKLFVTKEIQPTTIALWEYTLDQHQTALRQVEVG